MRILQKERKTKLRRPSLHPTPTSYLGLSPSSWTETLFCIKVPTLKRKEKKKKKDEEEWWSENDFTSARPARKRCRRPLSDQARPAYTSSSSSSASPREGGLRKENNQDTRPAIATRSELAGRLPLVYVNLLPTAPLSSEFHLNSARTSHRRNARGRRDIRRQHSRGDFGESCFS